MSSKQELNGKAFEYSLLKALTLNNNYTISKNATYINGENKFLQLPEEGKESFLKVANKAVEAIRQCEPNLTKLTNLNIVLQPDSKGIENDVRDIVIWNKSWELGISAKNNNKFIKSVRCLTKNYFFQQNFNIKSSDVFNFEMELLKEEIKPHIGKLWNSEYSGKSKEQNLYIPMLEAINNEIKLQLKHNQNFPTLIMNRFLGNQDYYTASKFKKDLQISALNIHGTLNTNIINQCSLPTKIMSSEFKEKFGQKNSLIITLNNGLSLSLRIHNGDSIIKQSGLKLECMIIKYPQQYYSKLIKIDK